ncbi:DUF2818 family protein [Thauera humireducens]|uniref:Transmembrane lipoprotein n=1 Tax=Thauera humireducens TaxID=1134435 RepID=A0A140IDN1_9RHOO|nr:DUF2818 family protein [Thauera humireducens]AMO35856.1 hypothetical protein AC731_002165 [Thauera humireducens]
MNETTSVYLLLAIVFTMANLPFVFDRILFVIRPPAGRAKGLAWRLFELAILYFVAGALAMGLEAQGHGSVYAQNWEFYATTFCLFLVFAFPGFVFRYLWHAPRKAAAE